MKQLTRVRQFGASLAVCAALFGGEASAITVSEISDFPGSADFPGMNVGTLTSGANSVSGALSGNCVSGNCNGWSAGDTQDSFTFTVGAGTMLDSLFVTTSNVSGPAGFSVTFSLKDPTSTLIPTTFLSLDGTTGNLLSSALGAGTYSASVWGQQATEAGAYSLNWSVGLNASVVPLPAAAWLFGSGLLGLMGIARRRAN